MDLSKQPTSQAPGTISRSPPTTKLQILPTELLHIILSFLAQTAPLRNNKEFINGLSINSGSLANLCRVSKKMNQLGLPYLYHTLNPDPASLTGLSRTLQQRSDLLSLVRRFQIGLRMVRDTTLADRLGHDFQGLDYYSCHIDEAERVTIPALVSLILEHVVNIEVLDVASYESLQVHLPAKSRSRLRELRLQANTQVAVRGKLLDFIRGAPQLSKLSVNTSLYFKPGDLIPNIDHLTVYDISVGYGMLEPFSALNACRNLKSFTIHMRRLCHGWIRAVKTMIAALMRHRFTLETLRIEPSYMMCPRPQAKVLSSLKKLKHLQHLSISTRFFAFDSSVPRNSNFLLNLPKTIRTLDILLEHGNTHPDISWFVMQAYPTGQYPNLESLTLRVPLNHAHLDVSSIAEACAQKGIAFTVTIVPEMIDPFRGERCFCSSDGEDVIGTDLDWGTISDSELELEDTDSEEVNHFDDENTDFDAASPDVTDSNDSVFSYPSLGDSNSIESDPEESL